MTNRIRPIAQKAARKSASAATLDLNILLAPEDIKIVYELDGVSYPEGLELISTAGARKLVQYANTPRAREFERWMDTVALPQFPSGR